VDQVPAGLDEAAGLYRSVVAGRRLLILLDNAVTAEQVRPLLPGAPGCLVVVTSRDRLAGLVAGQGARRLVLDPLSPGEAEALLADVVGAERVGVEAEAAADLAGLCAHLPLALRIAAANLADDPHRRVAAQAAALREGDRLAALEIEGDPHNAVRAAFDVSYQRLAPPERHLFWLLGLVPGPDFTAAAAAALAATNPEAAERTLGRLAAAHLVDRYGPGRYRLHDLLRLYAAERSQWDGDEGSRRTAAGRLLDHYLHTTDQAARLLYPHGLRLPLPTIIEAPPGAAFVDPARALEWLDAESANLFAAVRHAAQHGPRPRAWLLADALRGYFFLRIPVDDWLDVARAGLAAAEAEDDLRAQAIGEMSLGDLSWHQGHYPEAIEHYRRARQRGEAAGWPEVQSAALGNLGQTYWRSGRLGDAIEHYTESLALAGETGWRTGQLSALADLGAVYAESGMLRLAYDQFTTALSMSTEPGSMRAYLFAGLGEVCHALGRLDEARDRLGQALASFQELGGRGSQADTLRNLAAVHTDAGRLDDALERAGEAQEIARQIDSPLLEAGVLSALGAVRLRLGEHAAALELLGRALRLAQAASARNQEAVALVGLATANRHLDQLDQAIELARQALRLAGEVGYRMLEGDAHAALAEVQLALGRHDQAVAHANQALTIHRETGHRLGEARALRVLGEALEHTDAGLAHWRAALAIFTEAGAMPEARALRDLVARRGSRAVARGNATRR
jgi:tetratricopeptide (TPR) repeat protein